MVATELKETKRGLVLYGEVKAPAVAPNVPSVLIDDIGFGEPSTYGMAFCFFSNGEAYHALG